MAQHVWGNPLVDTGPFGRALYDIGDRGRAVLWRFLSFKEEGFGTVEMEVFLEQRKQTLGQGQETVFIPFGIANVDDAALEVKVGAF